MPALKSLETLAPSVELPIAIGVICYGPHADLARRFLESLYKNTDPSLFTLRAGTNEAEKATHQLLKGFSEHFGNIQSYTEPKNVFKNPLMRRMLHEHSIGSRWTIWCDDDTHFTRPDWLQRLALRIEHEPDVSMWGWIHKVWMHDTPTLDWIRRANWYRGMPFDYGKDLEGRDAVEFRFATGAFWALRTEIIYQLDWPDTRLKQGAEDFILGEALRQHGHKIGNFRHGVAINDYGRRNVAAPEHTHILT